ncbi:sensor domain-containing protein [Mycobacteroides salmoniphilum]
MLAACSGTKAEPPQDANADLFLSIDDMVQVTNFHGFVRDGKKSDQPTMYQSNIAEACHVLFDQYLVFGTGFTNFRSITYGGSTDEYIKTPVSVSQVIANYPDAGVSRTVFEHLVSEFTKCSAAHLKGYELTVQQSDPSTLLVSSQIGEDVYRVKSSVVINVGGGGLPDTERAVKDVTNLIASRVS